MTSKKMRQAQVITWLSSFLSQLSGILVNADRGNSCCGQRQVIYCEQGGQTWQGAMTRPCCLIISWQSTQRGFGGLDLQAAPAPPLDEPLLLLDPLLPPEPLLGPRGPLNGSSLP